MDAGVDVRALFSKEMLAATGTGAKGGTALPETHTATIVPKPIPAAASEVS